MIQATQTNENRQRVMVFLHLLLAAGIFVYLRLPLLAESICDSDLSGILYSGWGITDGLLPFRDIFETKPPGTYLLFALMIRIFGLNIVAIHVLAIAWGLGALAALYFFTTKVASPKAGVLAAYAYAFCSASDLINGICPNYETWAVTPGLFGLLFFVIAMEKQGAWAYAILAGVCLGLSMSFKFQGVFFAVAAAVVFVSYIRPLSAMKTSSMIKTAAACIFGAALVWLFYFGFFGALGAGKQLLAAVNPEKGADYAKARTLVFASEAFFHNIGRFIMRMPVLWVGVLGAILATIVVARKKLLSIQSVVALFALWGATLFAAFFLKGLIADGHYYQHYLVLAIPGFCALFGYGAAILMDVEKGRIFAIAIVALAFFAMIYSLKQEMAFARDCQVSFAQNPGVIDEKIITEYRHTEFVYGIATSNDFRRIGNYLAQNSTPDNPIFVWDPLVGIYLFAKRRAPTYYYKPYFSSTHLPWSVHQEGDSGILKIRKRIMAELSANPPRFIVQLAESSAQYPNVEPMFKALREFVESSYSLDEQISDAVFLVWKHKTGEGGS